MRCLSCAFCYLLNDAQNIKGLIPHKALRAHETNGVSDRWFFVCGGFTSAKAGPQSKKNDRHPLPWISATQKQKKT